MKSALVLVSTGVLFAIGTASLAAPAAAPKKCAPGLLRVVVASKPRCLALEERVQIRAQFLQLRDAEAVARTFHLTPAIVRSVSAARTSRIAQGAGNAVALGLSSAPRCTDASPPRPVADLRWTPAQSGGLEQRIAVTVHDGGIESGLFTSSAPLKPDRGSFTWTRMQGQANHTWVVLTLTADGWTVGEPGTFVGPLCPVDYQR